MVSHCFIHTHGLTLSHPQSYLVDICMGFKRVPFLQLLFARLLKHTSLKPMHCHSSPITQALKPIRFTTKRQLGANRMVSNDLKPMRIAATIDQKEHRNTRGSQLPGGPAIRITFHMRPRSFASPARTARTARTKRKRRRNEADLPVTGVGQAGLAPLNLRYIYTHIYIYIYIYIYHQTFLSKDLISEPMNCIHGLRILEFQLRGSSISENPPCKNHAIS